MRGILGGSALALADAVGYDLALGFGGGAAGLKARMPVNVERASAAAL